MVEEPKWHWMMHQLLSRFQQQGILCDTTLACSNGEAVKAHSCVLAAASQRIRALLDGVQSGDYTLQMGSVTSSTWRYILRFIYDGRVSLPSSEIQHVKDAAMRFQIVPLVELIQALERLRTREGANRRENSSVQPCSSDIIVLEDDDEIVNEITDLNESSNQSASVNAELSCINSSCLEPVNSDALKAVNVGESLDDIEMDEIVHKSHDSSVTVANLQTEASLSGHNELTVDHERPVDVLDVSDVFENGRPHDTKRDCSGADVTTRSSPAESPLPEGRNESSDFLSKLIVPVSCFANNLNSGVEPPQDSLSQPSAAGFSHSKRDFSGESMNFELTQSSPSSGDNRAIACQTMISAQSSSSSGALLTYSLASGTSSRQTLLSQFSTLPVTASKPHITGYNLQHPGLSPVPMDIADRVDEEEPLLCISDVVSLSAQNTKFGDDKADAHRASSSSCEDRGASYALTHQAMLPVPAPIVSKAKHISEDQLRNSVIKSRIVQGSHVAAAKRGVFDLEKRNPTLTAMLSKEKSEQVLGPAPWPVLLVSRPETQNSNEIVRNTNVMHDNDDDNDANPSIIRPHVIEPIDDDDDGSPSSQPESQTLHDNQTEYLCGIAPTSVSLSYITVPVHVQGFSSTEDLPAAPLRKTPSFSGSRPSAITSQQPTAPTLDGAPCKFKQPALLRHPGKNQFSFFTGGTQAPHKQMRRGKRGSVTKESTDFGQNTKQKTLSSAALGSLVTGSRPGVLEYAWPGDGGQFGGCSKLVSDGVDKYRTPADQSSSMVKHRRRKRAFKSVRSGEHLDDGLMLAPEFGTATDHNYFMQPDSTVSDAQTLQSRIIDVYSFTDSETCGSGEKKSPPSVKGAFKTAKRPRNKQCHEKSSHTKLQPDDSNKSQEPMKRKGGRCRKIPLEEQSLSRPSSSAIQFVGKEIWHEWVVSNNPRTTDWFRGKVIRLVKGTDGEPGCQYEVLYKDDDTYIIDHLLDDYKDGSIKFCD